jgi:hypothetical protein
MIKAGMRKEGDSRRSLKDGVFTLSLWCHRVAWFLVAADLPFLLICGGRQWCAHGLTFHRFLRSQTPSLTTASDGCRRAIRDRQRSGGRAFRGLAAQHVDESTLELGGDSGLGVGHRVFPGSSPLADDDRAIGAVVACRKARRLRLLLDRRHWGSATDAAAMSLGVLGAVDPARLGDVRHETSRRARVIKVGLTRSTLRRAIVKPNISSSRATRRLFNF